MIQTILFDFGGVLLDLPDHGTLQAWLRKIRINDSERYTKNLTHFSDSLLLDDVMRGKIKEADFYKKIAAESNMPLILVKYLVKRMQSKKNLNREMLDAATKLRGQFQIGILSNTGDSTRQVMVNRYHFDELFNEIIISAEEGVAKPDEKLFWIALERVNSLPENTIFIDDMIENIEAAKKIGLRTIHHADNQSTIACLELLIHDRG